MRLRGARARACGGGRGLCCGPGDDSFGGGARGFYLELPGLLNLNPARTLSCLWLLFTFLCLDALAFCGCSEVSSYLVAFATPVSAMDEIGGRLVGCRRVAATLAPFCWFSFPRCFGWPRDHCFERPLFPTGLARLKAVPPVLLEATVIVAAGGPCCDVWPRSVGWVSEMARFGDVPADRCGGPCPTCVSKNSRPSGSANAEHLKSCRCGGAAVGAWADTPLDANLNSAHAQCPHRIKRGLVCKHQRL